jgi:hypothetical protein
VKPHPVHGGAMPGSLTPPMDADSTAQHIGTSWPPTLPAQSPAAPIGFSNVSNRLAGGLHLGEEHSPPPGQLAVVMAALMIGLLMMGTQLWLLTVALELYLGGHGREVWLLALVSGAIFAGGLMMLQVLGRRPRVGHEAGNVAAGSDRTRRG